MKHWLASLALVTSTALHAASPPCGAALGSKRTQLEGANYRLAFTSKPSPIPSGKFFSLEVVLCPKAAGSRSGALSVDAIMPRHQHGMNYRASIASASSNRFRAEGLLFHMPGLWHLHFDIAARGDMPAERLTFAQEID